VRLGNECSGVSKKGKNESLSKKQNRFHSRTRSERRRIAAAALICQAFW
jgi:hypothetical protein